MDSDHIKVVSVSDLAPAILDALASGSCVEMTTTGRSMRPMLYDRAGSVRLGVPRSLSRGDVILYRYPDGKFALHRIVRVCRDGTLTCRGDNLTVTECHIHRAWVFGAVSDFTYRGKWVSCADIRYRLYWHFWLLIWPVRYCIMRVWRRLSREFSHEKK